MDNEINTYNFQYEHLNKHGLKHMQAMHTHSATENKLNWQWDTQKYNRIAAINLITSILTNCNYLEIGCNKNALFNSIPIPRKTGVDPACGGTHRMTSDDFFKKNKELFDVIFIDGLHEYHQVHKDAENSLKCLSQKGWILFHDLLPRSWQEQHIPRLSKKWTGDSWKVSFELIKTQGIDFKIISIDHGVGILRLTGDSISFPDLSYQLKDKSFDFFYEHYKTLPIISWEEAYDWILTSAN